MVDLVSDSAIEGAESVRIVEENYGAPTTRKGDHRVDNTAWNIKLRHCKFTCGLHGIKGLNIN